MFNKIIYTDIDFVLHDYLSSFLEVMKEDYDLVDEIDTLDKLIAKHPRMNYALEYHYDRFGINGNGMDIIYKANEKPFIPTVFALDLIEYLKDEMALGASVRAITARGNRASAEKILHQAFGFDIPVATVETRYKSDFMQSSEDIKTYYIDDAHDPANKFALLNKNNKVYVPSWPWNNNKIVKNKNIERLDHNNLIKRIKERKLFDE